MGGSTAIYHALSLVSALLGTTHEFAASPIIAASLKRKVDHFTPDEVAYFNLEQWHRNGLTVYVIAALYLAAARADAKSERRQLLGQIAFALSMCIVVASFITGFVHSDPRLLPLMLQTPLMYVWTVISSVCALAMSMDSAARAAAKAK